MVTTNVVKKNDNAPDSHTWPADISATPVMMITGSGADQYRRMIG